MADIGAVLGERVLRPLGIDDLWIGKPPEVLTRYVQFPPAPRAPVAEGLDWPPGGQGHFFNSSAVLGLCLPWGNGVGTASALAATMDVYAFEGTVGGVQVFGAQTFADLITPRNGVREVDRVLGTPAVWGLGVLLVPPPAEAVPRAPATGRRRSRARATTWGD